MVQIWIHQKSFRKLGADLQGGGGVEGHYQERNLLLALTTKGLIL